MSTVTNKGKLGALLFYSVIIVAIIICVFTFWLFPTGVTVLSGFDFINVTSEFVNALYWFFLGLIVLTFVRSTKIQM